MLANRPKLEPGSGIRLVTPVGPRQRWKMVLAIVLLLVALGIVLVKDQGLWFGPHEVSGADLDTSETPPLASDQGQAPPASPDHGRSPVHKRVAVRAALNAKSEAPTAAASEVPAVTTNRQALPPLEVEVVAGDKNPRTLRPGSNSIKVQMQPEGTELIAAPETPVVAPMPATNASEHVRMSADTSQALSNPVDPSYPMLAKQMKVQGAVVLQALIGSDGLIQDLRVLSGPGILASAAREAVKQWRFKPYLQNGQAVETEAKITVNFTISTF
jgi:periplasmic protein TonB